MTTTEGLDELRTMVRELLTEELDLTPRSPEQLDAGDLADRLMARLENIAEGEA
jgi:hypothetical protein